MLTYDEYREAAATIAQDAVRGVDPEVIREHLSDSGRSFGPADVAAVRSLLSTAYLPVRWSDSAATAGGQLTALEAKALDEADRLRDELARVERERDEALATDRAEIARQIAELADNETALLGWLSTCNPQPITVPTVLRALAGMIGAGQPAAAAEPAPVYHWSRAWGPSDVERMCPCRSAPCGFVIRGEESPDCVEHAGNRTMRAGHPADRCPGSRS